MGPLALAQHRRTKKAKYSLYTSDQCGTSGGVLTIFDLSAPLKR